MLKKLLTSCALLCATILGTTSLVGAQDAEAEVSLLHAIPGFGADVSVDGEVILESFDPGDIADLQAFAGQTLTDVEVRATGTETIAIGPIPEFAVPSSGSWTIVAHLSDDGMPVITPFQNGQEQTPSGQARLTVRHVAAAPGASVVAGTETLVSDAANGESEHLTLPVGEYSGIEVEIGDETFEVPAFELDEGENLIVYVGGSLDDGSIDFFFQQRTVGADSSIEAAETVDADTTPAPTQVNTGGPLGAERQGVLLAATITTLIVAAGAVTFATRRAAAR